MNTPRIRTVVAFSAAVSLSALCSSAWAQHAEHHEGAGAPAGMSGNGMSGMMMPSMGGGSAGHGAQGAPMYPSLLSLPSLPPERRAEIASLADQEVKDGLARLAAASEALRQATQADDPAAMQAAAAAMREGLAHLEAGVSARRVLAEGKPPRNMALDWFRREMNLSTPVPGDASGMSGGVSVMHALVMALLVAFALAMIALYFVKMRRAAALLASLGAGPGAPTPGTTPRSAAAPAAPEAPAPAPTAAQPAPTSAPAPPRALWSGKLRVGNIQRETPSVKTFRLMLPSGDPIPFTFAPGQFVNVFVQIDGKRVTRSYSIASSPTQRGYVELGIKREEHGLLSRHLHDVVKVGDELDISGPVGRFTFTGTEDDSVVLIAGGVGITPMMSIVRYLSDRCWPGQIYLVFLCRAPEEFIFRDELEALQRQNPRLQVTVTMSRAEGTDWKGPRGRVSKDLLLQAIPDLTKRRIHLCGPPPMMDAVKALLGELGVPPDHLHTEAFGPPSKANPAVTVVTPPAVASEGPLVSFSRSGKSARIRDGKTVLDLADELGVSIDSSCRAGTCGVCKVKLASGEVTMAVEDALDAPEKASGVILACQARPRGDIAVEA